MQLLIEQCEGFIQKYNSMHSGLLCYSDLYECIILIARANITWTVVDNINSILYGSMILIIAVTLQIH